MESHAPSTLVSYEMHYGESLENIVPPPAEEVYSVVELEVKEIIKEFKAENSPQLPQLLEWTGHSFLRG